MTDLRFARAVSWGKSAIVDDICLFPLRDRAVSRGAPPAASSDVLFDGDSSWSRSENQAEEFRQKNLDAHCLEVVACYGGIYAFAFGGIYAFAFGGITLEQHIPAD